MSFKWTLWAFVIAIAVSQLCVASIIRQRRQNGETCKLPSADAKMDHTEIAGKCELQHGSTCSVKCKSGFIPHNPDAPEVTLVCVDGQWKGIMALACRTPQPCKLPSADAKIDHTEIAGKCELQHGSICSVICKAGFIPHNPHATEGQVECVDGEWKEKTSLVCYTLEPCKLPSADAKIDHTEIAGICELQHGSICSVQCKVGFIPHNPADAIEAKLECVDGEWKEKIPLVCRTPQACYLPSADDKIDYEELKEKCDLEHGKVCFVKCKAGLIPQNPSVTEGLLECVDGIWKVHTPLVCKIPAPCQLPSANYQKVEGKCDLQHGYLCSVKCKDGYMPQHYGVAEGELECVDGEWKEKIPLLCRTPQACYLPSADTYSHREEINEKCELEHNKLCSVKCKAGLVPQNPGVTEGQLECDDGKWKEIIPLVCRIPEQCQSPSADSYSYYQEVEQKCDLEHNKLCLVKCKPGFIPQNPGVAEGQLECEDGKWKEKSRLLCITPNACYLPSADINSHHEEIKEKCELKHNKLCSVKCKAGLVPQNPDVAEGRLECVDGEWKENITLVCKIPAKCQLPSADAYSYLQEIKEKCELDHNKWCSVKCKDELVPRNPGVIEGQLECEDGHWKVQTPLHCKSPKACYLPSADAKSDHEEIKEKCELEHNKWCSVKCKDGLVPQNPGVTEGKLECEDGRWKVQTLLRCKSPGLNPTASTMIGPQTDVTVPGSTITTPPPPTIIPAPQGSQLFVKYSVNIFQLPNRSNTTIELQLIKTG